MGGLRGGRGLMSYARQLSLNVMVINDISCGASGKSDGYEPSRCVIKLSHHPVYSIPMWSLLQPDRYM